MTDRKVALFTVSGKTQKQLAFAQYLSKAGWGILASGGTAKFLHASGIPVIDIAGMVGPPILNHRVVTLSREIFAGILALESDKLELKELRISRIDLVCVDLYPLQDALADPDRTYDSVLEKIDIGGPSLLRAAAKGERLVISAQYQIDEVINFLEGGKDYQKPHRFFLAKLAAAAEEIAADHATVAREFYTLVADGIIT